MAIARRPELRRVAQQLMWWQRIIVNHKKIKGWYMTPSHYLWQDLSAVWLDQ